MKSISMLLTVLLTCTFTVLSAQVKPTTVSHINNKPVVYRDGQPILFKGIQYWGLDHWNATNWDEDLDRMVNMGLNGIRLNIAWDHIEMAEDQFDFSALDTLLNKIEQRGLMVMLQMNQSAHDWKPAWFEAMYDESDLVAKDETGGTQYGRYSFSSQAFKLHYYDYIKTTISHIKNRECIVAYSVYTEPHFADKIQWLDYSSDNKNAFRDWLRVKYNDDISTLNTAWGTDFKWFGKIVPYKLTPDENWENMPLGERKQFVDWRVWNCVAKANFIGDLVQECKAIDSNHLYIQNMMWKWSDSYAATVALDPEINYAYADIIGINTYPNDSNLEKVGNQVSFIMSMYDYQKPVWLGEFNLKSGNAPTQDLTNLLDEGFEAGATGFVYFTYNGQAEKGNEEFGIEHYGVLDRYRNKKQSFYDLKGYLKDVLAGQESAILNTPILAEDVNFLWSKHNKFFSYLDKEYCLKNYYAARTWLFHDKGYNLGIVTEEQFKSGDFDKTKPLIVPSSPFTDQEVANKINEYVTNDGMFVMVNGRFGENLFGTESAVTVKGYPRIDDNLGINVMSSTSGTNTDPLTFVKGFFKIGNGTVITPLQDKVTVEATSNATVLAEWSDGSPAVLDIVKGSGRILYYGAHLFNSDKEYNRDFNAKLLKSFMRFHEDNYIVSGNRVASLLDSEGKIIKPFVYGKALHVENAQNFQCQIFALSGTLVFDKYFENKTSSISLSHLQKGIYLVKVKTDDNIITTKVIL